MAPVYALMISFGIVAVSGAVVGQGARGGPTQTVTVPAPPPPKESTVRFLTMGGRPAVRVAKTDIYVDGNKIGDVDRNAEFTLVINQPSMVCANLPDNLISLEIGKPGSKPGQTCWGPIQPGADMDVHVEPR